jgi:hypothetical protein
MVICLIFKISDINKSSVKLPKGLEKFYNKIEIDWNKSEQLD